MMEAFLCPVSTEITEVNGNKRRNFQRLGQKFEAGKGIPKNFSSQVFSEVRVNFLGEFLQKPFIFVNRRSE